VQEAQQLRFSVGTIPAFTNTLTPVQKRLLDLLWNQFVATGKQFHFRALPQAIGKVPVGVALKGLNDRLVFETSEGGDKYLALGFYGALLTSHGLELADLLVRLLNLVKELYEKDALIKEVDNDGVRSGIGLSDSDTITLFCIMRLNLPPDMPIRLASWYPDGRSWKIAITDQIIALFCAENTAAYLDELLAAGYDQAMPWSIEDRQKHFSRSPVPDLSALLSPDVQTIAFPNAAPTLVSRSRLNELRKIQNSLFDCTRLICLCEELNECAAGERVHAVIFLTRAILDHIPPIFGCDTFVQVASNYSGNGKSFRKSTERLEKQSRQVADRLLHMPIRDKESAPHLTEVCYPQEIESVLAEVCRILKA